MNILERVELPEHLRRSQIFNLSCAKLLTLSVVDCGVIVPLVYRAIILADDCYIQFLKSNEYLTIATAVAAFYLPVVILCAVYHRIYRETRRHQRKLYELQAFRPPQAARTRSRNAAAAASDDEETGNQGCVGACRKFCGSVRRGCSCGRRSAECDSSDVVEGSFGCA